MIQKLQTLNHSKYTIQILSKSQRHLTIDIPRSLIQQILYPKRKYHFPRPERFQRCASDTCSNKISDLQDNSRLVVHTAGVLPLNGRYRSNHPTKHNVTENPCHIALNAPLATLVNLHRSHKTMILSIESAL